MDTDVFARALSSRQRLSILKTLKSGALTANKVHELLGKTGKGPVRRETTYRHLEHLVRAGILSKKYDSATKRLLYSLDLRSFCVNLDDQTVEPT